MANVKHYECLIVKDRHLNLIVIKHQQMTILSTVFLEK